jgi:hypothetical protein
LSLDEVLRQTEQNARRAFGLDTPAVPQLRLI